MPETGRESWARQAPAASENAEPFRACWQLFVTVLDAPRFREFSSRGTDLNNAKRQDHPGHRAGRRRGISGGQAAADSECADGVEPVDFEGKREPGAGGGLTPR